MERRKKGSGQITRVEGRKSPWRASVVDSTGRQKSKFFKTEKEAKTFLREINADANKLKALLETGVCMIQNSMFTLVQTESGSAEYIQNFQLQLLPDLTYSTLNILSTALSGLIILILAITFLWLRSKAITE